MCAKAQETTKRGVVMEAFGGESALAGIVKHCFGNAYCYFIGFVIIFSICNF